LRNVAIPTAFLLVAAASAGCGSNDNSTGPTGGANQMTFFVTSATSLTGNLGGLRGADATCQRLAAAAGAGDRTWRAYLSADRDPDNFNQIAHARGRIGHGPWVNARGVTIAYTPEDLHSRSGDASLFVDERGVQIAGQWAGSPRPIEHDILTGSTPDGTLLPGFTCDSWNSSAAGVSSQVGHSDGFGPNATTAPPFNSWNSAHSGQCANTAPGGGSGRFYCFAQ
jgi:hypothetical protein